MLGAATNTFAAIMGGSAVAGVPAALRGLSMGILGLAGPIAVAGAAIAGFILLATKSTAAEEGTLRPGGSAKTYGTKQFWENFAQQHGWKAVPLDVVYQLRVTHTLNAPKLAAPVVAAQGNRLRVVTPATMSAIHQRTETHTHNHAAPVSLNVHVTATGGKVAFETGNVIGAQIVHHLSKAGHIVNAPLGAGISGSRIPASA